MFYLMTLIPLLFIENWKINKKTNGIFEINKIGKKIKKKSLNNKLDKSY